MFWKVFAVVVVVLLAAAYITRVETIAYGEGNFVQEATKRYTLDEKIFRVCTTHTGSGGFVRCSPWRSPALSD